jgi:hypothetical protein
MIDNRYLKLNVEILFTDDEWEMLQYVFGQVSDAEFAFRWQEEHGNVDGLVDDPQAFLHDFITLLFGQFGPEFYAKQRERQQEIVGDDPF